MTSKKLMLLLTLSATIFAGLGSVTAMQKKKNSISTFLKACAEAKREEPYIKKLCENAISSLKVANFDDLKKICNSEPIQRALARAQGFYLN